MKLNAKTPAVFILVIFPLLFSCRGKPDFADESIVGLGAVEKKISNYKWYCLKSNGFEQVERPQKAPAVLKKPWTESIRISYMAQASASSPLDMDSKNTPKVFALVNRLGLVVFDGRDNKIHRDESIFAGRTSGNLVFMNGTPVFSVYKNSHFNTQFYAREAYRPFLVQFVQDAGIFFPILTYENLSLDANAEVTDFCWNGTEWFCSAKLSQSSETKFAYVKFKPETALLSISPEKNLISIEESSEDEFREQRSPKEFAEAPERVKNLLKNLPSDFNFYVECKFAGGTTPREYIHGTITETPSHTKATVQISDTWIAAMFQDGTTYLDGALYGRRILNNGNTIAFRLPRLPRGYVYSDFGISGTDFFAAWEESEFYNTGRAGFIWVDLAKTLYN